MILDNPPRFEDNAPELDIDTNIPTRAEIREAIKKLKNHKAPGYDELPAELLKADIEQAMEALSALFKIIWKEEKIPSDWQKGLIAKLPKKGDLSDCNNWRGVTLLSITSKVFTRTILMRIEKAVESQLREEQAGFRKGRSCTEQIFVLRNIIKQCIEWQSTIYLNFIDFQKAFDSIHRETMWKILRLYGIPEKIIRIIQALYNDFTCSVLHNGNLTPWFAVQSGVKQGYMLSPLLFLTVLDWIMKETIKDNRTGIRWTLTTQLEDLDFADDICLTSSTRTHLRSKTLKLCSTAKKVGMKIGIKKTKLMTIGESPNPTIKINGQEIETVDKFTYLGV